STLIKNLQRNQATLAAAGLDGPQARHDESTVAARHLSIHVQVESVPQPWLQEHALLRDHNVLAVSKHQIDLGRLVQIGIPKRFAPPQAAWFARARRSQAQGQARSRRRPGLAV